MAEESNIREPTNQKRRIKRMYAGDFYKRYNNDNVEETEERQNEFKARVVERAILSIPGSRAAIAIIVAVLLFILIFYSGIQGILVIFSGNYTTLVGSSYLSPDEDILKAEDMYLELEAKLKKELEHIESDYPGYDEYEYELDEIIHNPYALISFLTAREGNFRIRDIKEYINELFKLQYELNFEEREEVRREEIHVPCDEDGDGIPDEGKEEIEEHEYTVTILKVTLINHGLKNVVREYLTGSQLSQFELYEVSLGNRPYLFDNVEEPESGHTAYDIDFEGISDEEVSQMLAFADQFIGTPYVWGGSSPSGFDCSGFVCYVINHIGGDVGRVTATTLYNNSTPVSRENAKPGDLIFFKNTYKNGLSHVGIYVGNGMMIHAGSPVKYSNINTNYWQEHFLGFTRLS